MTSVFAILLGLSVLVAAPAAGLSSALDPTYPDSTGMDDCEQPIFNWDLRDGARAIQRLRPVPLTAGMADARQDLYDLLEDLRVDLYDRARAAGLCDGYERSSDVKLIPIGIEGCTGEAACGGAYQKDNQIVQY